MTIEWITFFVWCAISGMIVGILGAEDINIFVILFMLMITFNTLIAFQI